MVMHSHVHRNIGFADRNWNNFDGGPLAIVFASQGEYPAHRWSQAIDWIQNDCDVMDVRAATLWMGPPNKRACEPLDCQLIEPLSF